MQRTAHSRWNNCTNGSRCCERTVTGGACTCGSGRPSWPYTYSTAGLWSAMACVTSRASASSRKPGLADLILSLRQQYSSTRERQQYACSTPTTFKVQRKRNPQGVPRQEHQYACSASTTHKVFQGGSISMLAAQAQPTRLPRREHQYACSACTTHRVFQGRSTSMLAAQAQPAQCSA
jgi:hypothetical protein